MKRQLLVFPALILCGALTAWAADQAKLTITAPAQSATVQALPNGTGVVMIKFKTDHFKIVSVKNSPIGGNQVPAQAANPSENPAEQGANPSATGNAGRASASAPGAPVTASNSQPTSESLPQSDNASATPAPTGSSSEGFIDVDVDGTVWHFLHSTGDPIVLAGLSSGAHRVALQLFGSNLRPVGEPQILNFTVSGGPAK